MGWTCIVIDVQTVRLIVNDIGTRAKSIEHGLCNVPRAAIGTVQTDLDTSERINAQRNQIAHVPVTACHIVHGAAAVAVDQLDTIVVVRIVAGGDHDAAVKVIHTSNVSYRWSGGDMEQISICSRSGQTSNQTVLKHIRAATSILADNDTSRVGITVALTQGVIVPSQETANLIGMIRC